MEPFASTTAEDQRPHVVLLASPAPPGHLIPLAELARWLAEHHGVPAMLVTFAAADLAIPDARSAVLSSLPTSVATATLPAVPLDDLPANARVETVLFELVQRSLPHLRDLLRSMSVAALVPDFFCSAALSVTTELGVLGYVFFPSSFSALEKLEPAAVEESKKAAEKGTFSPTYPVGPFVRSISDEAGESVCLEWLDRQSAGSVVYVSFGSAGMLSVEQTRELAARLEMSGHRFLWVVRMPSLNGGSSAFGSNGGHDDDPLAWLPDGFLERTCGRGLAVAAWAPQVRVLSQLATAVFVSHCGWKLTLESVAAARGVEDEHRRPGRVRRGGPAATRAGGGRRR
uniref:UDP-glycosyltransferases domain-containing protein n=1 Tax=Oryza punctata TaxID=4537 RepID=A0A0E0JXX5_ORYPU